MALSRVKCQGDRRGYHAGSVRIAIVTDYYYPHLGGITEHVHGQATELTRRGHEVTIVTGNVMRPPPIVDGEIRPEANVPFIGAATVSPYARGLRWRRVLPGTAGL